MSGTHLIIGAGQAGGWAAVSLRQAGFAGRIVLIGAEPWLPYERPPLSKAVLTAEIEPPIAYFRDSARYDEHRIETLTGVRVVEIDRKTHQVRLADGRVLAYDRLLLATGGRARALTVPGGERALCLRTLDDARAIRARLATARQVVCIGAGVIGLEVAASARARGAAVTVLEAAARPMGRSVSSEGADFVARLHRDAGVDLRCGVAVAAIAPGPGGTERVLTADGGVFPADLVLAGVGMERALDLAAAAGLALDGGIAVDAWGRSSDPAIFAAGDVAAFLHPLFPDRRLRLESWRHAQNHGIAVGRAMAGGEVAPYDDIPWFWTDQHGVNLQVAGFPAEAARTVVRVDRDRVFVAVHLDAADRVIGVTAAGSPRDIRAGTALIRAACPVDPRLVADASVPLPAPRPPGR